MDQYIPEAFSEITRCFANDILEDGRVFVGLCTSSGQLLELIDNKVQDSFDLEKNADEIKIFTSYNPHQKYYLVRCQKQLTVIKRCTPLIVIKTYENVIRVKIADRLRLGRPQVVIWTMTEKDPIVTDFVSQLEAKGPKVVSNITLHLSGKLQEMTERLAKAQKILQEKRHARVNAMYQSSPNITPSTEVCLNEVESKVLALGKPFPLESEEPLKPASLQLSRPWGKSHNSKWIMGIPAFNSSNTAVKEVRLNLRVDCQSELSYQTQVIVFPPRSTSGAQWTQLEGPAALFQRSAEIPAHTSGVIVGVLDELPFKMSSTITVCGCVFYKQSGDEDDQVTQDLLESDVKFTVENLICGRLRPFFTDDANESDLVSVVATSSSWQLDVLARYRIFSGLNLQDYGLQRAPSLGCWVGHASGALYGLLVLHHQISTSQHQLTVYAKDLKQVLLLVQSLLPQWRVEEHVDPPASLSDCVRSLDAELKTLLSMTKKTCPNKTELSQQLGSLQLTTDLNFASYKQFNDL